jgi:membrane protein required for colicin V production
MVLDVFCILFLVLAMYKGITRGFIRALLSLVAFVIGWILASLFAGKVGVYLQEHGMQDNKWVPLLSFLMVMIATFIGIHLLGKALDKMTEMLMMGWLNKLAGVLLYVLLYTLLMSTLLYFSERIHLVEKKDMEKSLTYPYMSKWAPVIWEKIGEIVPYIKEIPNQLNLNSKQDKP